MKYIVRYGEIGTKSPKIRRKFEKKLISNMQEILDFTFENKQGRIIIETDEPRNQVDDTLQRIFGIVSYSPVYETVTDQDKIDELISELIPKFIDEGLFNPEVDAFAIKCRRVGQHDFSSQDMAAFAGSVVIRITDAKVNLSNPDFTLYVEVRDDKTYIYHEKIEGLGGLPVGSQGKVVCLISSGIDSPVASFQMLKRGCSLVLLHCDNDPFNGDTIDKVKRQAKNLERYSAGSPIKLYTIKLGRYLEYVREEAPPRMTCVLCKSGMYQSAAKLADKMNAQAVVDGSSLGQVASQTLTNMEATHYHCEKPIFSPLICFDKIEIEAIGKKINSYPISIIPDGGCTAVPRYPETHADLKLVKDIIKEINQKEVLDEIFETLEEVEF